MEESVFNKYSIAVIVLVFLISACSHTPSSPDPHHTASNASDPKDNLAQKADFISPLLSDTQNTKELSKSNSRELIWQHIENGLALTDRYNHPRVIQQKNKYLAHTNYLVKSTQRSEPFIHFVLSEIENRQLPTELAVLPIVESGYYPRARSRASAEGLWQIMPFTAKELGLKRTAGYDGRHDVYESTMAALNYLTQMYNTFDGDWLLALAAYNAGPHRVKRALKSATVKDEHVFWNLRLPRETREYVPKILAIASIIKDKEYNGTILHPIEDKPLLTNIELSKRISPAKLVQTAEASESEIKLLNPAIRNLNTPIEAGYQLLVPKQDAEFLALAIDNMQEAPLPKWTRHKINRGESLSGIARRYGINIHALREANNMHNNRIVAGRTLVVPLRVAEKAPRKLKTASKPIVATSKTVIDEPYVYIVALGDSYWKIANRNNTTVKRLFEINGRSADHPLRPGESILVD